MTNLSKVKKEFAKKFLIRRFDEHGFFSEPILADDVWSFIEHSLLTQRKQIIKEIEGMKIDYSSTDPRGYWADNRLDSVVGYNQAIDDIINQIK